MCLMSSLSDAVREAAQVLQRANVPEARREAASLVAHVVGGDRTFVIAHSEQALSDGEIRRLCEYVERRAAGEPLQYITGHQEFYGLDFRVTPDVLIPRPETELLVETALRLLNREDAGFVCDAGTGSGCIIIAILHERPRLRGVALDLSPRALAVAAGNASRHGVGERLRFIASDYFAALDPRHAKFDMIVSNPPYVPAAALPGLQREVRDFEPRIALTPGNDGLAAIRVLLRDAPRFIRDHGYLLIEIGYDQEAAVRELVDPNVWEFVDIYRDLQEIPRTLLLRSRGDAR